MAEEIEIYKESPVKSTPYLGLGRPISYSYPVVDYSSKRYLEEIDIALDKETGNTRIVVTGMRDTVEEIQACKEQSGFENMRHLLASGQATIRDFADDGLHGQDTIVPDNINDAYRANLAAQEAASQVKDGLGIDSIPANSDLDQLVTSKINEALAKIQNASGGEHK